MCRVAGQATLQAQTVRRRNTEKMEVSNNSTASRNLGHAGYVTLGNVLDF